MMDEKVARELSDLHLRTVAAGRSASIIVCAANRLVQDRRLQDVLLVGPRHFDQTMIAQLKKLIKLAAIPEDAKWDQGFIDQHGIFLSREAAFVIAKNNFQIRRQCGNPDSKQLFSEHLY